MHSNYRIHLSQGKNSNEIKLRSHIGSAFHQDFQANKSALFQLILIYLLHWLWSFVGTVKTLLQGIIKIQSLLKLTQDVQDNKPLRLVFIHLSNLTFPNITKARCICQWYLHAFSERLQDTAAKGTKNKMDKQKTRLQFYELGTEYCDQAHLCIST